MSEEAVTAQEQQATDSTASIVVDNGQQVHADDASPPDVGDALAQLNQRLSGIEERLPEAGQSAPEDPWDALTSPLYEDEPAEQPAPQQQATPDEQEQLVNEFYGLVDQRVEQMVKPHFEAQAREARAQGIRALAKEFPDFMDHVGPIGQEMQTLADEYRNPAMAEDPRLARRLYQARKAEAAAQAETPAEAVSQGATLETGAGPGNGDDGESYQEKYLAAILPQGQKDAFT